MNLPHDLNSYLPNASRIILHFEVLSSSGSSFNFCILFWCWFRKRRTIGPTLSHVWRLRYCQDTKPVLFFFFTVYQLLQAPRKGDASAWERQKYWIPAQVFPQRLLISYRTSNIFGGSGNMTTLSISPAKFIMRFKRFLTVKLKHEPRNNKLHSEISARKHKGEKKEGTQKMTSKP